MKGAYFDALTFDSSNAKNSFLYIVALKQLIRFRKYLPMYVFQILK